MNQRPWPLDLRLHLHGSPWLVNRVRALLRQRGFQELPAERTRIWKSSDVLEAEAFALLPQMLTMRGARWLLGQPARLRDFLKRIDAAPLTSALCEEIRGIIDRFEIVSWFSRPLRVAIVGPPNAGKSTLANALADQAVSLVSPLPGTTRDWVEAPGEADGFPVVWIDTAGLRSSDDTLESAGIERTRRLIADADATVVILDATPVAAESNRAFAAAYFDLLPVCLALNKADLLAARPEDPDVSDFVPTVWRNRVVQISALQRTGILELSAHVLAGAGRNPAALGQPAAFTVRQVKWLTEAIRTSDHNSLSEKMLDSESRK